MEEKKLRQAHIPMSEFDALRRQVDEFHKLVQSGEGFYQLSYYGGDREYFSITKDEVVLAQSVEIKTLKNENILLHKELNKLKRSIKPWYKRIFN